MTRLLLSHVVLIYPPLSLSLLHLPLPCLSLLPWLTSLLSRLVPLTLWFVLSGLGRLSGLLFGRPSVLRPMFFVVVDSIIERTFVEEAGLVRVVGEEVEFSGRQVRLFLVDST